jgi:HAD superfamily hydrolase (TIGR01490 family)
MIAFLDFDGTLLRRDSGVICALPSIRRGLLGARIAGRLIGTYLLVAVGARRRAAVQRVGFQCYAGRTLDELRAIMRELHVRHMRAFISPAMRARVEAHRRAGDRLVILTASAFFFAEPLGEELQVDELIGTQVQFADGVCTGEVDGEILDGAAKLAAARACAERAAVPLARCVFYSDHVADLPLLEAVGTPVAVGPHRALRRIARRRHWSILAHDDTGPA